MNAGGQLAGLNFPNWTGFAGPGAEPGSRPRRQHGHDQGVQRLARRRVVRRVPRAGSSRAASSRCGTPSWPPRRSTASPPRAVHAVTFSENPEALNMPSIHSDFWDPVFTAACDTETVLCCHVGSSSRGAQVVVGRAAERDDGARCGIGRSRRSASCSGPRFWERFPDAAVLAHRGRHRVDPVLPRARRARAAASLAAGRGTRSRTAAARRTSSASTCSAASSARTSASS